MEGIAAILAGRRVGLDVDQIADAIWLAQFLTGDERARPARAPRAPTAEPPAQPPPPPDSTPATAAPPADPAAAPPASEQAHADIARAPRVDASATTARFRSPAAAALGDKLGLARALRPLAWRSPRPGAWRIVEDVTADRIACTGLWLAELEPETEPALDLVVVIDASPRLRVWQRLARELIDVLRSVSAFRVTTTWFIDGDRSDVALRTLGGRHVPANYLLDAAHHTAALVVSDFADILWSTAAGLACLRQWSRHLMLALVSLVPQRSWSRNLLGALPATRLTSSRRGVPSAALDSDATVAAGALPVPVLSIAPESLGTWAHLVAGHAGARARGALLLPDICVETRVRYAAAALQADGAELSDDTLAELAAAIGSPTAPDAPRTAAERVERFCRSHRPEVVDLAAALISARSRSGSVHRSRSTMARTLRALPTATRSHSASACPARPSSWFSGSRRRRGRTAGTGICSTPLRSRQVIASRCSGLRRIRCAGHLRRASRRTTT
jgi:hypothetical protein